MIYRGRKREGYNFKQIYKLKKKSIATIYKNLASLRSEVKYLHINISIRTYVYTRKLLTG